MRIRILCTAAALALVGVTVAGCGGSDSDDPAKADAQTACDLLDRMGKPDPVDRKNPSYHELNAAVSLAVGAAERDHTYQPLRQALEKAANAIQAKFDADNPTTKKNLAKAKDICADL